MLGVVVEIRRLVDASYPGWVECGLTDIGGREWLFVEKVPVVTAADFHADSGYPQRGVIGCHVVEWRRGSDQDSVIVDTERPWGVEATTGHTRFEVRLDQLVEYGGGDGNSRCVSAVL